METSTINLDSAELKSRLSSIMGYSKVNSNNTINLKKVKSDTSDTAQLAKQAFKRKPFYFSYDENGMFK